ncbi:MAG TPA: T9SS type A sorting domain-containing protein [Chitinophagales bacterium]|nr:T9SS type A sorting domain-containing protein [Chitinophagales bacterium]
MKKVIFTLFSFCLLSLGANAQYCGHTGNPSGPNQCTPSGTLSEPGLSPASDSLPAVNNGEVSTTVIQFKNFDTLTFGGQVLTIQTLRLDSIGNLPSGLCWTTNKANNTWANQEDGCIKVNGTTCSTPGQHKLKIIVTANVGINITTDADAANLKYYVRVKNLWDAETAVDTTQTSANPFIAYGNAANCAVGIKDVSSNISSLNVAPNPFNNKAAVSFYSDKAGVMTERMTNMIGSEVFKKSTQITTGLNTLMIDRSDLPTGVYFYSISDGKTVATKRVVISE